jgi:hypothetical protein
MMKTAKSIKLDDEDSAKRASGRECEIGRNKRMEHALTR